MRLLALDTCLNACSVALVQDGDVLAVLSEPMSRGHQERLALMVREVLAAAGAGFDSLDRIAVTLGPGSFTGLRVGMAFAKGLGAALSIPVIGVGTLEALAASVPNASEVAAIVGGKRGQAFLQIFRGGAALTEPANVAVETLAEVIAPLGPDAVLAGPGVDLLFALRPTAPVRRLEAADPAAIARLARTRAPGSLSPLYLRAPDAKLPGGVDP